MYLKSSEFESSVKPLIHENKFGKQILVAVMFLIQKHVLRDASDSLQSTGQSVQINCPMNMEISAGGEGKSDILVDMSLQSVDINLQKPYKIIYLFLEFTKKDLIKILKAYGVNLSMSKNKPELGQVLSEKLNEHSAMPNYCIFKDSSTCTEKEIHPDTIVEMPETEISVPSATVAVSDKSMTQSQEDAQIHRKGYKKTTRQQTSKTKGRQGKRGRGRKLKQTTPLSDSSDENCGICGKPEKSEEDWICCDICSIWYHRDCVGLEDETSWLTCSNPDAVYTCPMCV
ncbi:unnamed protein product [Mytilus coruscus]|uniref:PHD-type domain-containing protein n=1 Tax=Mytilus coruscus TaxID=42192 RepID=A0A6J8F4U0_MYTCO|nr:unnamed protein product [Mytilus coruscus]